MERYDDMGLAVAWPRTISQPASDVVQAPQLKE